jgi:hypothetical protein
MIKLEERKKYLFRVVNILSFPDSLDFFVLSDPFGDRHLLPSHLYKSFNITLNSEIECVIDKINCKGEIFIEPIHPYYQPGQIYKFTYSGKGTKETKYGERINVIFLKDIYNQMCWVKALDWQIEANYHPEFIDCKVERIKKGLPKLLNTEFKRK